jgi:excisionase family DNA binding protein
MKPLKNIEQTAELLGISPWTVRSYVKQGKLHPVRIGRRVLLGEDELERFVGQNQEQAEVKPTTNDNELNPEERQ